MGLASEAALVVVLPFFGFLILWTLSSIMLKDGSILAWRALLNIVIGSLYISIRLNSYTTRPAITCVVPLALITASLGIVELSAYIQLKRQRSS